MTAFVFIFLHTLYKKKKKKKTITWTEKIVSLEQKKIELLHTHFVENKMSYNKKIYNEFLRVFYMCSFVRTYGHLKVKSTTYTVSSLKQNVITEPLPCRIRHQYREGPCAARSMTPRTVQYTVPLVHFIYI
jgi:hypothetical protein